MRFFGVGVCKNCDASDATESPPPEPTPGGGAAVRCESCFVGGVGIGVPYDLNEVSMMPSERRCLGSVRLPPW